MSRLKGLIIEIIARIGLIDLITGHQNLTLTGIKKTISHLTHLINKVVKSLEITTLYHLKEIISVHLQVMTFLK